MYSCQDEGQVCFWATPEATSQPSALPCCFSNLMGLECRLCLLPFGELWHHYLLAPKAPVECQQGDTCCNW